MVRLPRLGRLGLIVGLIAALALGAAAAGWITPVWNHLSAAYDHRFRTGRASVFLMGTYVVITAEGRGAQPAVDGALARLEQVDRRLDAYDPTSDLARLAANAGLGPLPVSDDTLTFLALSDRVHRLSGGAFDPTVGPLVDLWGFGSDPSLTVPPTAADIAVALGLTGWDDVHWNPGSATAELARPGMSLVSGALAKGYAVDQAVVQLRAGGVTRAVIDAGGDLYLMGRRADGAPWRIAVTHPRASGYLGVVLVPPDTAIATSGDYERYFEHEGRRYHHLIDPRTGRPAQGCLSVTVVAPTAAEADALATAVFVLGPESGLAFAEGLPEVEAFIYTAGGDLLMTRGMVEMFIPTPEGSAPDAGG